MGTIGIVLAMLVAVVVSALLVRLLPVNVPRPLVQIALGAFIAMVSRAPVKLDPQVFFLLFLPPLLFLDGWRIPNEGLRRDRGPILGLALGLVVCTVLGMGLFIHWLIPPVSLPVAFALAAIISPTDPVAVSAITARVPLPDRIMHRLEGESLLNDASGLVCFRFAIAAAVTGTFSLTQASATFVWLVVGGLLTGVVMTYGVMRLKDAIGRRLGEDSGSQVLISLLIPFAAYQTADSIGSSGILAAVAAGITMSYVELWGSSLGATRMQRTAVWNTVQFALNGVMFVLLGEQLPGILSGAAQVVSQSNHINPWWLAVYVLAINLGLACLRFLWVALSLKLHELIASLRGTPSPERANPRLIVAMSLGGVRGAVTLAGVLTVPLALADGRPFPERELIVFLAAGVIVASLLAASIGLPRLLRSMRLPPEPARAAEMDRARVAAAQAAIRAIEEAQHQLAAGQSDADITAEAAARIMDLYRRRIEGRVQLSGENAQRIRRSEDIERRMRVTGLRAERDELFALARSHVISDASCRTLVREIDLLEERFR
jgi:CPA1 family monovalent cation:H+ antiporter